MPDDAICKAILQMMDAPLIATRFFLSLSLSLSHTHTHTHNLFIFKNLNHIFMIDHFTNAYLSVKSPKENEWMLDPITIADVYGPEVWVIFYDDCFRLF